MSSQKRLSLDLTQERSTLKILPSEPILSSHLAAWNGILLRHYHQLPAHELPEYSPQQHVIITYHHQNPMRVERVLDGKKQSLLVNSGDITVVPANITHGARWDEQMELIVLIVEPNLISHVAREWVEPDTMMLLPHFSKPDPFISQMSLLLKDTLSANKMGSRFYAESMATALSAHLLQYYSTKKQLVNNDVSGLAKSKLKQAKEYIHDHLTEDVSLEAIANEVGMSRYYFVRLFKQSTGLTPYQYLIKRRLEKAKELLVNTELPITNIALLCGFATHSHLTKAFRQHLSVTPKTYRKMS